MSRDYGQHDSGRRQARSRSHKKSASALPGWIWLVAGLSAGLAVAAFVYVSRPAPPPQLHAAVEPPAALPKAAPGRNAPIPLPPKEKSRFTFYEILRSQEVLIPQEETRAAKPPAAAGGGEGLYVIQVASFRARAEAERQKASLALIGIESRIETVTIDGKDTYYRVRVGPETNWSRVQNTLARLDENGIEALLIKLR